MTSVPSLTGKDIVGILKKAGFRIERQRGSHVFLINQNGLTTVVAVHSGVQRPKLLSRLRLPCPCIRISDFISF